MKYYKLSAVLISASILAGVLFTGCNKETKPTAGITIEGASGESIVIDENSSLIEEETTWYSTDRVNIADAFRSDGGSYAQCFYNYLGMIDNLYCCIVEYMDMSNNEYERAIIAVNSNGDVISRIELQEYIADNEYFADMYVEGDIVKAIIHQNSQTETLYYTVDIDVLGCTVSDRTELVVGQASGLGSFTEITFVGDRMVETYVNYNSNETPCSLVVTDSDSNEVVLKFSDYFPEDDIYYVQNIYQYGNNAALVIAEGSRGWDYYIKVDFEDMSMEELCPGGTRWLGRIYPSYVTPLNGHFYAVDRGVVKEIDYVTHETYEVFDFNNCNINRYDLNDSMLVDFTEDTVVLSCKTWEANPFVDEGREFYLYKLTAEDVNPNAGKAIIEVGIIGDISRPIADAIYKFNESNEYFYMDYDNRYDVYDAMSIDVRYDTPDDVLLEEYTNAQCVLSNQMAMDLLNGEGPDIIINGFGYGQLNNENYMLDLSDYFDAEDAGSYFTNVIDGSRINGALYQIPLSFKIEGIVTNGSNVGANQIGFTFDEYMEFVDVVCNGSNPIKQSQLAYFNMCVDAMSDLFMDGSGLNYDNEAFRALADYVNDNVFEPAYYSEYAIDTIDTIPPAYEYSIGGFATYLNVYSENHFQDMRIMGYPSYDGRGPVISVIDSVGISAQALNPDACWDLVEILLGETVQDTIAAQRTFPINISSYETTALEMINNYNNIVNGNDVNYSFSGMGLSGPEVDELVVQGFADACIEVAHVAVVDPTISIIVSEEIQPYFVGQKTIDEIIVILQDRVGTVMAERG